MQRLILIDGSGYIFRAFYALPPMTRPDGTPVNAVYGFTNMLLKQSEDIRGQEGVGLAVVFDAARRTFRHDVYPDYKANRAEPPETLVPQFPLIKQTPDAFCLPSLEQEGFEADDLIATYVSLARQQKLPVTIVSSDKDLMQLIGEGVDMYDPVKERRLGPEAVFEKFGVGAESVVDVQALAGDSSDNIPGVPGIGLKTASQLIREFGNLESLLARAQEIKQPKRRQSLIQYADQARLSRRLSCLRTDAPLPQPLEALAMRPLDPATLLAFLEAQDFKTIAARVRGLYLSQPNKSGIDKSRQDSPASNTGNKVYPDRQSPLLAPDQGQKDRASRQAESCAGSPKTLIPLQPQDTDYVLVNHKEALQDWIAKARTAGIIAIDTETTSLDAMRADLVGISLSIEAGTACYIPLGHRPSSGPEQLALGEQSLMQQEHNPKPEILQIPLLEALDLLSPLLNDPAILKIGHNLKYDLLVLSRYDISVSPIDDSMVLSYVLDAGRHGHGLDELAGTWLDHQTIKYNDVTGTGKSRIAFDRVPVTTACDYAAEDADMTLRLHTAFKPRLVSEAVSNVYETLERPLIPVLVAMERVGVKVNARALVALSEDFSLRLAQLATEIHGLAGEEFTIASPKQLGEILFEKMGFSGGKKGKSGAYATGANILEDLAGEGHELPARILDWRQLTKLKSTYTDSLFEAIHPQTRRVHTSFGMASAATGRLSSSTPNLQNIPIRDEEGRKIRKAFIAEAGHVLLSVDYSQIELRLLAHVAGIAALKQAFDEGRDIHAITASRIFRQPLDAISPSLRRKAKAVNFGIIYGISAFGLARQLTVSRGEAQEIIDAYFAEFPGIRDYMEAMKTLCRQKGYVRTLFGRKIHVPHIHDKNPARRGFAERAAINAPLQGAAADIIKRAMIDLHHILPERLPHTRMLLQVHDELVFETPVEEVETTAPIIADIMEKAPHPAVHLSVPLIAETGWADNWADAH